MKPTIETRQMAYFVLAAQMNNHFSAAEKLGVARSTLSENISFIEEEIGLTLFQRGPLGHYPTEEARWLYQAVEPILQAIEIAPKIIAQPPETALRVLRIRSPLRFMLGRLSRAISTAARHFHRRFPGILLELRFDTADIPIEAPMSDLEPAGEIVIDYADNGDEDRDFPLFDDGWVAITNTTRYSRASDVVDVASLQHQRILVPNLPGSHLRRVNLFCEQHGLATPLVTDEDVGTFPNLSRDVTPFFMLAPKNLVLNGVAKLNLSYASLPESLRSPVVARIAQVGPAAAAFIALLRKALASGRGAAIMYDPRISMRQVRYFLELRSRQNITTAARALNISQPALSARLRQLENVLRTRLFIRSRSGLELTPQGVVLGRTFECLVRQIDQFAFNVTHRLASRRRQFTFGVIPLVSHHGPLVDALGSATAEWQQEFKGVSLQVVEAPSQTLQQWVRSGSADLALVETQITHATHLDLKSGDALGVVTNPNFALLPPGDVDLADTAALPLILPGSNFGLRQMLDAAAATKGLRFSPQWEVNSLTLTLSIVMRLPMAAILPYGSVMAIAGALQFNKIVNPNVYRRLSMIFSADRSLTDLERSFIHCVQKYLNVAHDSEALVNPSASGALTRRRHRSRHAGRNGPDGHRRAQRETR